MKSPKKNQKILIVDDEEAILEALTVALMSENYSVETMARADGLLNKIQNFKPNLIILDVLLSGQDGKEVARNLKNNPNVKNIPILMMSAHPNARAEVIQSNANDFLPKPFDLETFLGKVRKLTGTVK